MGILKTLLFSIVVAAAGILPVSGNGHAAAFCSLFGASLPTYYFLSAAVCLGASVGVFILHAKTYYTVSREGVLAIRARFSKDRFTLPERDDRARRQLRLLLLGLAPCLLFFIPFGKVSLYGLSRAWTADGKLILEGMLMLAFGVASILLQQKLRRRKPRELGSGFAAICGAVALLSALFPGLTATGLTVTASRLGGVEAHRAFRLALLLMAPFLFVSGLVDFAHALSTTVEFGAGQFLLAFVAAAVVTVFTVGITDKLLRKNAMRPVFYYLSIMGIIITTVGIIHAV